MEHQVNRPVIKNYTFTALLSFCIIFLLLVSMSNCHGSYHVPQQHHTANAAEHQQNSEAHH